MASKMMSLLFLLFGFDSRVVNVPPCAVGMDSKNSEKFLFLARRLRKWSEECKGNPYLFFIFSLQSLPEIITSYRSAVL